MSGIPPANPTPGVTLRQAALIAGACVLIMALAAPFAEVFVYPKVVVPGDIQQTAQSILAHRGLFLAGIACYLITFICDVVVAWAYYVLLAPAAAAVSLLTAWFRLLHAVIGLSGLLKLITGFRLLTSAADGSAPGSDLLNSQIGLLLNAFRYEWGFGLVFFGIHLLLLGLVVYRSGYIPRLLGILLAAAGLGNLGYCLGPYLYPGADLRFLMVTFSGEPIFMVWLLLRGRKLQEPAGAAPSAS